jgi:hypothetical protein
MVGWPIVWVKLRVMESSHAFSVLLYNRIEGRGEKRPWKGLQLRGQVESLDVTRKLWRKLEMFVSKTSNLNLKGWDP